MRNSGPGRAPEPQRGSRLERVAVASVFLLLALLAVRQVGSLDAGFHLEAGEYILSHGWPGNDPFSFTMADHPYLDTSWGYQVLITLVHRAAGAPGLTLFHAALVLVAFGLVHATIRLEPKARAATAALLLLGGLASEMRFEVRPEVLSYALLSGVLYLLQRHAAGRRAPLWALPPTFVLWVNSHGLFVLGWVALLCFVAGLALRDRAFDRRLVGWSAVAAAAGLLNPYGWRTLAFPLTLATRLQRENVFSESIGEFVSPFALDISDQFPFYPRMPIFCFYALVVLVALSLFLLLSKRRFSSVLLVLPFLWLASAAVRNIPPFAIACLPGVAAGLAPRAPRALRRGVAAAVVGCCLLLTARVVHDAHYLANRRVDRFGLGWNREALPVDAVDYAVRAGLDGRVLNHLGFGGYLMWARPQPVFIDGRLEVVGERFFEEYLGILGSESELERAVARYGIEWIVFSYKIAPRLLERLSRDPRWRLSYVDHLAVIFVRAGSAADRMPHPSALAATGPPARARLESLPGLGASPRRAGPRHWLAGLVRRERFPTDRFGRGLFHYFRGEPAHAAPLFAQAIEATGGAYYEMYANLGSSLFRLGRLAQARECYRIVLEDRPANELARRRLAEIAAQERR